MQTAEESATDVADVAGLTEAKAIRLQAQIQLDLEASYDDDIAIFNLDLSLDVSAFPACLLWLRRDYRAAGAEVHDGERGILRHPDPLRKVSGAQART